MATVITQFPTSNAVETGAGLTSPNNAHADDGSYATALPGKNVTLATKYQNFGFDSLIPLNSVITKVQIIYEWKCSTTGSVATARAYSKVSNTPGTNRDDAAEPAGDTVRTFDITAERSWTRANLLNGTFEVALSAVQGSSSTAVTFSFDYVKVEVTFDGAIIQAENAPAPESASFAASGAASDSGGGAEAQTGAGASQAQTESGGGAEGQSVVGVLPNQADSGAGTEVTATNAQTAQTESTTGSEVLTASAENLQSQSSAGIEGQAIQGLLVEIESGAGSESQIFEVASAVPESAPGSESIPSETGSIESASVPGIENFYLTAELSFTESLNDPQIIQLGLIDSYQIGAGTDGSSYEDLSEGGTEESLFEEFGAGSESLIQEAVYFQNETAINDADYFFEANGFLNESGAGNEAMAHAEPIDGPVRVSLTANGKTRISVAGGNSINIASGKFKLNVRDGKSFIYAASGRARINLEE